MWGFAQVQLQSSPALESSSAKTSAQGSAGERIRWRKALQRLIILSAYGVAFTLLRTASSHWATHKLFSVWFPAAGLRFAFLWIAGSRWTLSAALAEFLFSVASGTVQLSQPIALGVVGVFAPCLVYGAVIGLVRRRMTRHGSNDQFDPLAFAMACVLGPMAACVPALAWAVPLSITNGTINASVIFSALLVFTLGDLLGILVLAPPILWVFNKLQFGRWSTGVKMMRPERFVELAGVVGCAWALVWLLQRLGDGLVLAPVLLAACWCGLRGGRAIAWVAIVTTSLIVLPLTGDGTSDAVRMQIHMQLACVAVGAYLAGSYADAQARAMAEISRRDRLLLHAERLKSLRAMSIAVIHEVSQPLSTIAIEARALVDASEAPHPHVSETREIAGLIARKAEHLAELIRRLRSFGSGVNDTRGVQSISQLVSDVIDLATPEAKAAQVTLRCEGGPHVRADVHDVEIRQAMLNLLRNAIAATPKPGGSVTIGWSDAAGSVAFVVENPTCRRASSPGGMGLGLIISRTIAQAHGGSLALEPTAAGTMRTTLRLPLAEGSNE